MPRSPAFCAALTAARRTRRACPGDLCRGIARLFDVRTVLLVPNGTGLVLQAASGPQYRLETMELAAAQWAFDTRRAGRTADRTRSTASDWHVPAAARGRKGAGRARPRQAKTAAIRCVPTSCRCSSASSTRRRWRSNGCGLEEEMRDVDCRAHPRPAARRSALVGQPRSSDAPHRGDRRRSAELQPQGDTRRSSRRSSPRPRGSTASSPTCSIWRGSRPGRST